MLLGNHLLLINY